MCGCSRARCFQRQARGQVSAVTVEVPQLQCLTRWSMSLLCWSRQCCPWRLHSYIDAGHRELPQHCPQRGRDELRWGLFVALHIGAGSGGHVLVDMAPIIRCIGAGIRADTSSQRQVITTTTSEWCCRSFFFQLEVKH